jgi:hypothetical protein
MNHRRTRLAAALLFVSPLLLGGCQYWTETAEFGPDGLATPLSDYLPIKGEVITGNRRTAVDIENLNGSVTVLVSDRYPEAQIYARANWRKAYDKDEWEVVKNEDWVVAEHVIEGENSVLRVLSQATPESDPAVRTEIKILMPSCDGVFIRNAGGNVKVIGAGGAHTIASGFEIGRGGHIEVRTSRDINDPVTLRTSDGDVEFVVDGGSSGSIDIQAPEGEVAFGSAFGRLAKVVVEEHRWTGVWNGRTNPVLLSTLEGNARMRVEENPEMFTTGIHR